MKKYADSNDGLLKALQDAIQPALQNMVLNYMSEHNVACAKIHAVWISNVSGNIFRNDNGTHVSLDIAKKRYPENVFLLTLWLSSEKEDKAEAISHEVKVEFDRELETFFGANFVQDVIGWDIKGFMGGSDSYEDSFYFQNRYFGGDYAYHYASTNVRANLNEVLGSFWNGWSSLHEVPAPLVVSPIISK